MTTQNTHFRKSIIATTILASLAAWVMNFGAAASAADDASTQPAAIGSRIAIEGLWVWKPIYIKDLDEQDKMLSFCERQHFNRLLIQIPWKPGTAQIVHPQPGEEAAAGTALQPEIAYPTELARLIVEASKRKIAVEALDGAPYMGDKVHWPETLATLDAIIKFNATLSDNAKLAGVHWDIEPYVRPDWKVQASREQIEVDYLQLLANAQKKLQDAQSSPAGSKMTLSVDIPMWYDNKTDPNDNCTVTFNGQTKNLHEHIQDIVDYVGIMSYRQKALGKNSSFEHVANELAYAEKIGKFVCPAFETIELKDTPQITFFGKSAELLQDQRRQLDEALKDRLGFGGTLVHNYPSACAVLEPQSATSN